MKLNMPDMKFICHVLDEFNRGIDKQPNRRDERRQGINDLFGDIERNQPGGIGVKHHADGVSASERRGNSILHSHDPAELDPGALHE